MRIPTEKYQGMLDIDDEELDDGLFEVDSLEVYDLEDDQKHRLVQQQSSSIVDQSPAFGGKGSGAGRLWQPSISSLIEPKTPRPGSYPDKLKAFAAGHRPPSSDRIQNTTDEFLKAKDAAKVDTLVLDGDPAAGNLLSIPPSVKSGADTPKKETIERITTRRIEFVTENIKLYTKKPSKKLQAEQAKGPVTESLGPSLASSILRKIGQSGLTVDKISTTKNTRFFVIPIVGTMLIMQGCLWAFYSLIFIYLSGITEQYNTARQFLFINFHPVLACYSTSVLQTQWALRDFKLQTVDRYDNIQSVIDDYDPEDPYFLSFRELYSSYNTHKSFTAPVDNRFIPALTKYTYSESIPLSANGSARTQPTLDNYKWELAMVQNFRMIEYQLQDNKFNGTFYFEAHHLLDRASLEVSAKTNTEIIVQQGVGYTSTRMEIFWYGMLCAFGLSGAMAIMFGSLYQYRAKVVWIYRTYRALDMKSLAKKMDQVEQLRDSMVQGGKDSVCLSNTYFMNLMLKSATNDLASTFKKSGVFKTGHRAKSRLMNPVMSFLPKKEGNIVQKPPLSKFVQSAAVEVLERPEPADKQSRGGTHRSSNNSKNHHDKGSPGANSSQGKVVKMSHLEKYTKSSEGRASRMSVKRIKSLPFFLWFGTGTFFLAIVTTFVFTEVIIMVNQFSSDQAKDKISQIYVQSQPIVGVKFYTLRALQGLYDTVLAHQGLIPVDLKPSILASLAETSALMTENTFEVNKIMSGYYGTDELSVFGGEEFIKNTCAGMIETDYYTKQDCQILLDTSMTKGYSFQYRWLAQTISDLTYSITNMKPGFQATEFLKSNTFLQLEYFCNFILMQQFNKISKSFFSQINDIYASYAMPNFVANTTLLALGSCALLGLSLLLVIRMNRTMKACLYSLLPLPSDQLVESGSIKMIMTRVGAFIH